MSKRSLIQQAIFLSNNPATRKPDLSQWTETDLRTLAGLQDKYKGKENDLSADDRATLERLIKTYVNHD